MNNITVSPYSKITDYIYIGTNDAYKPTLMLKLIKLGIQADISVEGERFDTPYGFDYFLWLPTVDFKAPHHNQLKLGVTALDFFVRNKIKVFVHCKKGQGRSPTLVAAYFISEGLTVDQAIDKIKLKRPEIVIGEDQRQALKLFEKSMKKTN